MTTTWIGFWTWIWSRHHGLVTWWTGARSGLLISMLQKLNWFRLTSLITLVLLIWIWMGLFLRCRGWPSLVNWIEDLTLSLLLKLPPRKLEPQLLLWNFFLLRLLCISINLPYTHVWNTLAVVWAGAPSCYLELRDKLQKQISRTAGSSRATSL